MSITMVQIIKSYQNWIEKLQADGHSIWFGTVQFNHLGSGRPKNIRIMQREVQWLYITLLTNIIRDPNRTKSILPILIGCPDSPVPKHTSTHRLADVVPNDGMHFHFILAVPPVNRLIIPLDTHIQQNMHIYRGKHGKISKFDLRQFSKTRDGRVADYLLKHVKRDTYTTDDILILPASRTELASTAVMRKTVSQLL
jgi:hypothetical protein